MPPMASSRPHPPEPGKFEAELVIRGEGEKRQEILDISAQLRINYAVDLVGHVENTEQYLYHSDVFVLSSRWEGFGNVIVEALSCGLPIVSTDCPSGPAEILEYGRYGRLVPVGDDSSLAAAMREALLDTRQDLGRIERSKHFSPDRAAAEILKLGPQR